MRLVLIEPDIPQNCGTLLRLAACLGVGLDIVGPAGFILDDRRMTRAALDYLPKADWAQHATWEAFRRVRSGRALLLTTQASRSYLDFAYRPDDLLLLGSESAGAPAWAHAAADERLRIPLRPGLRSLNVAVAGAMVVGEALRQTQGFPGGFPEAA
ncbi:MAG TPA: TrmH family RNA methyltransferase [Kiloniellales bacterium]|nr:TrmH family RNA methyltransferase [Kiloniellales bacterium]